MSEHVALRFVVLHHTMPDGDDRASHWDLMLESGSSLRTWALDEEPAPGRSMLGDQLPDHRLAYLDFEGPISGDRGEVQRVARGDYTVLARDGDRWRIQLHGSTLHCELTIAPEPGNQRWRFEFTTAASSKA